jgi:hypothetical protein
MIYLRNESESKENTHLYKYERCPDTSIHIDTRQCKDNNDSQNEHDTGTVDDGSRVSGVIERVNLDLSCYECQH